MVFWRLKCVSPGFAGPFRLWLRRTCLLRYAASCLYRVLRVCYGTLLCILFPDTK